MSVQLTIGQVGKKAGLPTKTIRFYEEIGLLSPAKRAENGYRIYDASTLEELRHIKDARDLGLPIAEIKKLMKGCGTDCAHSKQTLEADIVAYQHIIDAKLKQLNTLKHQLSVLKANIHDCGDTGNNYCCNILKQLSDQVQTE